MISWSTPININLAQSTSLCLRVQYQFTLVVLSVVVVPHTTLCPSTLESAHPIIVTCARVPDSQGARWRQGESLPGVSVVVGQSGVCVCHESIHTECASPPILQRTCRVSGTAQSLYVPCLNACSGGRVSSSVRVVPAMARHPSVAPSIHTHSPPNRAGHTPDGKCHCGNPLSTEESTLAAVHTHASGYCKCATLHFVDDDVI